MEHKFWVAVECMNDLVGKIWWPTTEVPSWPGSAPMPHYTPWYGLCVDSVMEPVPGMDWMSPRMVISMGNTAMRGDRRRANLLECTRRLVFKDLRHHSPYEACWPGDTPGSYSLEGRTPWGAFPLCLSDKYRRMRPRMAQRKLGGYGGDESGRPCYTPPGWCAKATMDLSHPSGDDEADLLQMKEIMFLPEGDSSIPVPRDPLDPLVMSCYRRFGTAIDGILYRGWGGQEWHTCVRYG
jgi:hypothetical protein